LLLLCGCLTDQLCFLAITFPSAFHSHWSTKLVGRRYQVLGCEEGRMMEGPRHQHLHKEWQEPLEERLALKADTAALCVEMREAL
jgi:hypothetical protein